ncbi:hypothetical protein BGX26_006118, partial [Mortierella sp. AD094]
MSIGIEGFSEDPESIVTFSRAWSRTKTGRDLLAIVFPKVTMGSDPTRFSDIMSPSIQITYLPPSSEIIIFDRDIAKSEGIPSESIVKNARDILNSEEIDLALGDGGDKGSMMRCINISGFGIFEENAITLLTVMSCMRDFVDSLRAMVGWIDAKIQGVDSVFADWYRSALLDEVNAMERKFHTQFGGSLAIQSTLRLRNETWIDDDVIQAMLGLFSGTYGAHGEYLFIPPLQIRSWRRSTRNSAIWLWGKDKVENPNLKKAFTVVMLDGNHWGAVEIDFKNTKISFGDSLSRKVPDGLNHAIMKWLGKVWPGPVTEWDKTVGYFHVPKQPGTSGSCGINALNAIEHAIDPTV